MKPRFNFSVLTVGLVVAAVVISLCRAEIPPLSPAELKDAASHVFSGKVARIYSDVDRSSPEWEVTQRVAEIQVTRVEKGKHEGRLAYVRFWRKRYTGSGVAPPGAYGHHDIPKSGSTTQVFVSTGEDGGYDVLSPNGFSPLSGHEARQ